MTLRGDTPAQIRAAWNRARASAGIPAEPCRLRLSDGVCGPVSAVWRGRWHTVMVETPEGWAPAKEPR